MNLINPRVALITGLSGYLGGRLGRYLLARGWVVAGLIRQTSRVDADLERRVTLYRAAEGYADVDTAVKQAKPDVVFHLAAAQANDVTSGEHALELIDANVRFGTAVVEAAVRAGVRAVVTAGTYWQNAVDPTASPNSLYAATKEAFEDVLRFYGRSHGVAWAALKLGDVYGAGDPRRKLFNILREAAASGRPLAMSPGEQCLPLVFVDDVVEAFEVAGVRCLAAVSGGRAYAVWNTPVRLRDAVATYMETTGQRVDVRWGERPYQPGQIMTPTPGERLPGWTPRTALADGLRQAYC